MSPESARIVGGLVEKIDAARKTERQREIDLAVSAVRAELAHWPDRVAKDWREPVLVECPQPSRSNEVLGWTALHDRALAEDMAKAVRGIDADLRVEVVGGKYQKRDHGDWIEQDEHCYWLKITNPHDEKIINGE